MKIGNKLLLLFLAISLLPLLVVAFIFTNKTQTALHNSIGVGFKNLTTQKANTIDLLLRDRVNEAVILASNSLVVSAAKQANLAYVNQTPTQIQTTIDQIDKAWIKNKNINSTALNILNNPASNFLKNYQSKNEDKYGEIFFTDKQGAAIAMTKTLSDYYQADEAWWESSFNKGKGNVFLDDRGFDESIGALALGVVVPIQDGDQVIGVLKINYKVEEVLNIVSSTKVGNTDRTFLARSQGNILINTQKGQTELTNTEKKALTQKSPGYTQDNHNGKSSILGYSPIKTSIFTRIPTPGEIKGVSGEKWQETTWYLFLGLDQQEAFLPVKNTLTQVTLIGLLVAGLVAGLAVITANSISRPIVRLTQAASTISKGNLKAKMETIESKDEIGDLSRAFNRLVASVKILMIDDKK